MSGEAEGFFCLGERSCGAWLTYLACISGPVSSQCWFSTDRCGRRKCWFPGNAGLIRAVSPTAASRALFASSQRPVLPSQLISPAWLGPVTSVTCPWAHLTSAARGLECRWKARALKVRVLCSVRDSQPVTGPWGPLPKKFVVSPLLAAPERKSTLVLS